MSEVKRNPDGTIAKGSPSLNPSGRGTKAIEAAYARIEHEIVKHDDYRIVVMRQLADAQGRLVIINQEGKVQRAGLDPNSTPGDRTRAASWIADRIRGKPIDYRRELGEDDNDPANWFAEFSVEQLNAIDEFVRLVGDIPPAELIAILKQFPIQSDSSNAGIGTSGTGAAGEAGRQAHCGAVRE